MQDGNRYEVHAQRAKTFLQYSFGVADAPSRYLSRLFGTVDGSRPSTSHHTSRQICRSYELGDAARCQSSSYTQQAGSPASLSREA